LGHYIANLRDIEFNLFEVLGIGSVLGAGRYRDLDVDTVRTMLDEVARLAEGPIADSFADADRNPPVFEPDRHTISVPAELAKSVQTVKDAEWWRIGLAEGIGGVSAPGPVTWAINEMLHCANPAAAFFYSMGPAMANALSVEGTQQQKQWAAMALERGWAATMVLTEADAGSDVGAGRTKASHSQTAAGTSRASNGSSPVATWAIPPRTPSISCWPGPRVPVRAPKC
jgi:alkylation response protein AidB-like acyl-CoA dehydrogenase